MQEKRVFNIYEKNGGKQTRANALAKRGRWIFKRRGRGKGGKKVSRFHRMQVPFNLTSLSLYFFFERCV